MLDRAEIKKKWRMSIYLDKDFINFWFYYFSQKLPQKCQLIQTGIIGFQKNIKVSVPPCLLLLRICQNFVLSYNIRRIHNLTHLITLFSSLIRPCFSHYSCIKNYLCTCIVVCKFKLGTFGLVSLYKLPRTKYT